MRALLKLPHEISVMPSQIHELSESQHEPAGSLSPQSQSQLQSHNVVAEFTD